MLKVYFESSDKSGFSEEIWAIIHTVELIILFDNFSIFVLFNIFLNLDAELEAEIFKILEIIFLPHEFKEP